MKPLLRALAGLAAALAVSVAWEATGSRAADVKAPGADPDLVRDVFLLLDPGPLHIRLKITIGGKSPETVRREYLARLFESLDADKNGKLTRVEFERSPLNTSRRGPNGRPLSPREAAQIIPASRLMSSLERVAGETLAFRQDNTARKTDDQVFAALDTDNNSVLAENELVDGPNLLLAKDQDEDDCLTLDEFAPPEPMMLTPAFALQPVPERPLAAASNLLIDGAGLLFGPRVVRRYDRNRDGRLSQPEIGLTPERFAPMDADRDGKLSPEELKGFCKQLPDIDAAIELEPPAGQMPRVEVSNASRARAARPDVATFGLGDTDVALAVRAFDPLRSALADAQQQFNRLDVDQNGYLDHDELKENIRFQRGLFETIDSDGDDKLFWPEMEGYVRDRAEVAATRCDIVLHDLGHGFFETLDRNTDGRLGLREIRVASATLQALRKPNTPVLRATDPPRRLHLEVIRGSFLLFGTGGAGESTVPRIVAQSRSPVGPIWFQRMDRNLDGDLTWKEFLGPRHVFEELDSDHDLLIDPNEAAKAQ
ncbi:MAG TPA: EF-hand domain-containing protein [Fimbriiglobus sp.]|nr:EF-hand domain-containing protein [Fimbriiglobus sp.]